MTNLGEMWRAMQEALGHIPISSILYAILILVGAAVLRRIVDQSVVARVQRWASRTRFQYDELLISAIRPPIGAAIFVLGFYFALMMLPLNEYKTPVDHALKVAVAVLVIWGFYRVTDLLSLFVSRRFAAEDEQLQKQFIPLLRKSIKTFVVLVGLLLIFQNLGYSVTSVLTGLGIGGLAVALAAQETLSNFFASIMLLTDMPFRVGDWVRFDDVDGNIESIGFRSTRVRTFEKSLIIVPNKIFMNTPIENFSKRDRRRIRINLGLTYDTDPGKIEEFKIGVGELARNHAGVDPEEIVVSFNEFRDSSLNVLLHCFAKDIDFPIYSKTVNDLNCACLRLAAKLGVSFAFPSQSLYWGSGQKPAQQP